MEIKICFNNTTWNFYNEFFSYKECVFSIKILSNLITSTLIGNKLQDVVLKIKNNTLLTTDCIKNVTTNFLNLKYYL
jgi:hypothetical protein